MVDHVHRSTSDLTQTRTQPIRVLHVLGGFNPGGVETWLLRVLQNIDRDQFQLDFWVHRSQPCFYDAEIKALGSRIFIAPPLSSLWQYWTAFQQTLKEFGPYQVVHSHVHYFSGWILFLAQQVGVPVRIAHSHLDTQKIDQQSSLKRRIYLWLMYQLIQWSATVGLGVSGLAAQSLFGPNWQADRRWQIFYCGIDLAPFKQLINVAMVRASFKLPENAFVVGHVGRFEAQKNHHFLINIMAKVIQKQPNTYLVLVGQGELLPEIQRQVQELDLTDRVFFAGLRRDIPQLMKGLMNVFVFPSLHEGLPLVLIEAQAAGLPCIISNSITDEVNLIPEQVTRCSLSESISEWVDAILAMAPGIDVEMPPPSRQEHLSKIEKSSFNIRNSILMLEQLYRGVKCDGV